MQPEIRHPDRVRVRIAQRDAKRGAALDNVAFFGGELLLITVYNASVHQNCNL